jgi:hypothetical protein
MRKINLTVRKAEGEFDFSTGELLKAILQQPSPGSRGIGIEEMRKRIKVLDKVDDAKPGETLVLEDAEYTVVSAALKAQQFFIADRRLLAAIDEIENAEEFKYDEARQG